MEQITQSNLLSKQKIHKGQKRTLQTLNVKSRLLGTSFKQTLDNIVDDHITQITSSNFTIKAKKSLHKGI